MGPYDDLPAKPELLHWVTMRRARRDLVTRLCRAGVKSAIKEHGVMCRLTATAFNENDPSVRILRQFIHRSERELFFEIFVLLYAVLVNLMEIMDGIDDENTLLLDDELHSDTDTDISSNYLDYSSDDSCSELSSDEDLSSARIFTEVDVHYTMLQIVPYTKRTSELFGKL
ncbi:hypothetical protein AVEN_75253-1 [Araneus ventricosus]|uniref:Uncharacterized protein n=1 Tax=Araneus ventricosus TaxID=182803 RepID=A0A4Y2I9Q9_ARAVE|nr:hypothetical protein AVEN_75253-1 [Araneus ventricosus]